MAMTHLSGVKYQLIVTVEGQQIHNHTMEPRWPAAVERDMEAMTWQLQRSLEQRALRSAHPVSYPANTTAKGTRNHEA